MQKILFTLSVLLVILTGIIAWANLRMNLGELAWVLQKQEFIEGNLSRMYLVARFYDQQKLYHDEILRSTYDKNDLETSQLFRTANPQRWMELRVSDALDKVSLVVVNTMRKWVDKPPFADLDEISSLAFLEQSFKHERHRNYVDALEGYQKAEMLIRDTILLGVVNLHRGFCYSQLGDLDRARYYYQSVIASNRSNQQGITAGILMQYLDQILAERVALSQSNLSTTEKANKGSLLLQCNQILDSLRIEAPNISRQEQMERRFVHGICSEETGKKATAAKHYLQTIQLAGLSDISRDANRRLFVMGSTTQGGVRIINISKSLNRILKDSTLQVMESSIKATQRSNDSSTSIPSSTLLELEQQAKSIIENQKSAQMQPTANNDIVKTRAVKHYPAQNTYIRVLLKNGKSFAGEILSTENENVIRLKTMIGVIGIRKSEIKSLEY